MLYEPTDRELVIRLKSGDLTALDALDQLHRVRTVMPKGLSEPSRKKKSTSTNTMI